MPDEIPQSTTASASQKASIPIEPPPKKTACRQPERPKKKMNTIISETIDAGLIRKPDSRPEPLTSLRSPLKLRLTRDRALLTET